MNVKNLISIAVLAAASGCDSDDNNRTDNRDTGYGTDRTGTRTSDNSIYNRGGGGSSGAVSQDARDFVTEAASGGMFEIQSSQLALQQNLDPEMERVARMMIDDHNRINQELQSLAQRKGITVPQSMKSPQQNMLQQLRNAAGTQFNTKYRDLQIRSHEETIALFERAARDLQDPDLKSFAQRSLPTLREHLDHLRGHSPMGSSTSTPRTTNVPSNENDVPDRSDLPPRNAPR
jgi:putative membrane protein